MITRLRKNRVISILKFNGRVRNGPAVSIPICKLPAITFDSGIILKLSEVSSVPKGTDLFF